MIESVCHAMARAGSDHLPMLGMNEFDERMTKAFVARKAQRFSQSFCGRHNNAIVRRNGTAKALLLLMEKIGGCEKY